MDTGENSTVDIKRLNTAGWDSAVEQGDNPSHAGRIG